MAIIAAFDLGTTALKAVVLDERQNIRFTGKVNLTTYEKDGFVEQDPEEWWSAFVSLSSSFDASSVDCIIFSSQMQDLYFIGEDGKAIGNAVLYNDQRGSSYVSSVPGYVAEKTSIALDGTIPVAKLGWFREHKPEALSEAKKVLIGAKDYLIYKLTGRFVSDVTNMATSGFMDIKTLEYIDLDGIISPSLLPDLAYADELAGTVTREAAALTGYSVKAEVYVGAGDAGASTFASGVISPGEYSINLGTSGWIAALSDKPAEGVFNLAAVNRGCYVNVIPVLNGANVHSWIARTLFPEDPDCYQKAHQLLENDRMECPSLLFLPYLLGERFPVADDRVRGVYLGLDSSTKPADLVRSALEGVAFSLKSGFGEAPVKSLTISGGGALESQWCQIFSDVFNAPVYVFGNSEHLSAIALSAVALRGKGLLSSYSEFIEETLRKQDCAVYSPRPGRAEHYEQLFKRFSSVYPAVKGLF